MLQCVVKSMLRRVLIDAQSLTLKHLNELMAVIIDLQKTLRLSYV